MTKIKEFIISSAIYYDDGKNDYHHTIHNIKTGYVAQGRRHHDCRDALVNRFYPNWIEEKELPMLDQPRIHVLNNEVQGFITNTGRFIDRVEGMTIALEANQILEGRHLGTLLFSEDLW